MTGFAFFAGLFALLLFALAVECAFRGVKDEDWGAVRSMLFAMVALSLAVGKLWNL